MKKDILYLDYNSTSPLSKSVTDYLGKGDLPFANAASLHSAGKSSRKIINEVSDYLRALFKVSSYHVLYHSGATEGINSILNLQKGDAFFYFRSDHPSVTKLADSLKAKGVFVHSFTIQKNGLFDIESVTEKIKATDVSGRKWLNFTHVHNETGVIWPLDLAKKIKDICTCSVHVDAVQSVGKFEKWNELDSELDAYTFSAHKFGALKGVGFSFLKSRLAQALIHGGGQQEGQRAGTENVLGIKSIMLALEDLREVDFDKVRKLRTIILDIIKQNKNLSLTLETKGASNLINFYHQSKKSDELLIQFDMAGIAVSSGSACSSGSREKSQTLIDLGLEKFADSSIRISFSLIDDSLFEQVENRLLPILEKL